MKNGLSLKNQLIFIILLVTLFSTTLAFSFSIIYDFLNSRNDLKNSMQFTARLMAENVKSPLLFNDELGANELLLSFRSIPTVLMATVIDAKGAVFASYRNKNYNYKEEILTDHIGSDYLAFDKNCLHISIPIEQENQLFGTFLLKVSTEAINNKLFISAGIYFLVLFVIMVVSYLLALRLQQIISAPVLELKRLAEQITHESDYSIRIPQTHQNEIGQLQRSLDLMVKQLNQYVSSLKNEIADRILSQQETMQLRAYLNKIIDSLSSVIIAVDPDGLIKQVNASAVSFLEMDYDSLIHCPLNSVLTMLKDKQEQLRSCMEKRIPQSFPVVYNRSGTSQQIYLNIGMFPLALDENQGIVIVIDDVTEKNRMESMMIQNEKMISLGGLAAGMAHEINNPLAIISQGVQNILRHLSDQNPRNLETASEFNLDLVSVNSYLQKRKVIHYLEGILSASKRASEIVANMLQFSRMSNQSKTPANINELIDQTIELAQNEYELKKKFDFRQIKMIREYQDDLSSVFCNVTEIQQVILNLLKNAAHALYEKKSVDFIAQITVRTVNEGSFVRIEIEDNGPGIPDEIRNRVFEPFFTTKEVGVGTGLGLSVSFFIVTKNHGGTIEFESSVGVGTRFIIRLPNRSDNT
ncbi:MAG: HAMP domain-containing protein [Fibrobacter sp.]|nr:HAMP domain-containing protein [Fibrobacter sp.]